MHAADRKDRHMRYRRGIMETTDEKLSKELYELSGWEYVSHEWMSPYDDPHPIYDLGYLIRRLPLQTIIKKEHDASPELPEETPAHYRCIYDTADGRHFWLGAATPEDA